MEAGGPVLRGVELDLPAGQWIEGGPSYRLGPPHTGSSWPGDSSRAEALGSGCTHTSPR